MKPAIKAGSFAAALSAVVLTATLAWATLAGVVTAVTARDVTVSGATYEIGKDTRIEDFTGQEIKLHEVRPGTSVELEFDDEGGLAVLRASVVR